MGKSIYLLLTEGMDDSAGDLLHNVTKKLNSSS